MADGVAVVGALLSIGLVIASAILNFRMGFQGADTDFDGWVYGLAVGMGDGLKALCPFVAAWGFRHRDYMATAAALVVFIIFTAYSFTAALGFAAEHRSWKAASSLEKIQKRGDIRNVLERDERRLAQLGPQRTPKEVEQAIAAKLNRPVRRKTVATVSANCSLNRAATRRACAEIAVLREELARANEALSLANEERGLRKALDGIHTNGMTEDPQADALMRVAKVADIDVDKGTVGPFLALVLALVIEFGSGMGLYVSTTPWRNRRKPANDGVLEPARRTTARFALPGRMDAGPVDAYALDRLEPDEGAELAAADLYADYLVWCGWRRMSPLPRADFIRQFADLARDAGMGNGKGKRYRRVKLIGR